MCKFHNDVAIQIATAPYAQTDPLRYSILTCALWRFWIDMYMPEMSHLCGHSQAEMTTPAAVAALKKCGRLHDMGQDIPAILAYAEDHAPQLRQAVDAVIADRRLSLEKLNLPDHPLQNRDGVGAIAEGIYEGVPAHGLHIRAKAENPAQEPMREVIAALFNKDGFHEALEAMIAGSFARQITEAQNNKNTN